MRPELEKKPAAPEGGARKIEVLEDEEDAPLEDEEFTDKKVIAADGFGLAS